MHKNLFWMFRKAVPHRFCDDVLKHCLSLQDQKGLTGGDKIPDITPEGMKKIELKRRSHIAWTSDPWIYNELHEWLFTANKQAEWNYEWSVSEPCQFTKYGHNEMYDWHSDINENPYTDKGRFNGLNRKISMTLTLSNTDEYTGGDFEFKFRNREKDEIHRIEGTREKGSIIFFPSFVWHRVTPVTAGNRYSLVIWSCGKPFR